MFSKNLLLEIILMSTTKGVLTFLDLVFFFNKSKVLTLAPTRYYIKDKALVLYVLSSVNSNAPK